MVVSLANYLSIEKDLGRAPVARRLGRGRIRAMTTLILITLAIAWPPAALGIAIMIGRGIRLADRRSTPLIPDDPRDL